MNIIRKLPLSKPCSLDCQEEIECFLTTEWLQTNGLGGYASCSISGVTTRKYHGMLISALPPPFGRTIMLNHLAEQLVFPGGSRYWLTCEERADGKIDLSPMQYLKEFRLEGGLPVWIYEVNHVLIEKRLWLVHLQNTVHISYKLLSPSENIRLRLFPSLHFRGHESPVNTVQNEPYVITVIDDKYEISSQEYPPLKIKMEASNVKFTLESKYIKNVFFRIESHRGYEAIGSLWSPGYFKIDLQKDDPAVLIASTESWETLNALKPAEAEPAERKRREQLLYSAQATENGFQSELVLAADQFIIQPSSRVQDAARARASGDEIRTIIAGYHWFTDWGRDTMISLEGLTLCTGRPQEARWILRTFNHYIEDGLIPNMFPEGQKKGLYHTADATLWFFHALDRYLAYTNDRETLKLILPSLEKIMEAHFQGTHFGIGMDPKDGLLKQGAEGYQLTWMDAKVEDWVVTPRRGKAVEINGLWYNALRLTENWLREEKNEQASMPYTKIADQVFQSFNALFWNAKAGYLFDVIEGEKGNDPACRPNQLLAISLKHPVLEKPKWKNVVEVVQERLLTPFGLRTLSQDHPDYKSHYDGDLRARDAAYHQGTVWAWLIGPFIDAWCKTHPDKEGQARKFLAGFEKHFNEAGIGSISEIFDAVAPYTPRGCMAQAWSIAEVLRCWLKTGQP